MADLVQETGVGLTNANVYADRDYFTTYFTDRNDTVALGQGDEDVDGALLYATRDLDQSFSWDGTKKSTAQALGWPRVGAYDKENLLIESTVVPEVVREACCERARDHLLVRQLNDALDPEAQITALEVGPVSIDWDRSASPLPRNPFYLSLLNGLFHGGGMFHEIVRA